MRTSEGRNLLSLFISFSKNLGSYLFHKLSLFGLRLISSCHFCLSFASGWGKRTLCPQHTPERWWAPLIEFKKKVPESLLCVFVSWLLEVPSQAVGF